MVPDPAAPALGERCAVCHDDVSVLRRSNCDHWFCEHCVMVSRLHSPALPPMDCPVCLRPITLLSPAGSSYLIHDDPEIAPVLNQIVLYNDCFAGLDDNLIQRCLGGTQDVTMVDGTSQWSAGRGAIEEESTEVTVTAPATETEGITVEAVLPASGALVSVLSYLPCWADRVHMSSVNRHWRNSLKAGALQLPPQLPWLLLPSSTEPLFHATMSAATHVLALPPDIKAHAKFRGSSEGGWFVLEMDNTWPNNLLYNINTGDRFELPRQIDCGDEGPQDMILVAAALSAPPSPYIIAAVVKVWKIVSMAYWTPSMKFWVVVGAIPGEDDAEPPDMLYHSGEFWFIDESETIHILSPQVGPSGMVDMRLTNIQVKERRDYQAEMAKMYSGVEYGIITRYLVKSRNRILMVNKYGYRDKPTIGNLMVRVFRFCVDAEGRAFWKNLMYQVPGRLLFVGRGCSRSFEARHYPGFQNHPKVYFLDDRNVGEDGKSKGYLRDGNGRFSLLTLSNELWPPAGQVSVWSDRHPPIWWLH